MVPSFDITEHLNPRRLTIAMWDFSWLNAHYLGGSFEDFDQVTDELLERGFNTVRIEAFPWVIGQLSNVEEQTTVPGDPLSTWGHCDKDRTHAVAQELAEFMALTKQKGIYVILSTWGRTHLEYPDKDPEAFILVWEKTMAFLAERDLLSHVLYIDLDQEFPFFSAYRPKLDKLGGKVTTSGDLVDAMEDAGQQAATKGLSWNQAQLDFVSQLMNNATKHFQQLYPDQRFAFSLTGFWDECRSLHLKCFDVLELHFWMGDRFMRRSGWLELAKDRSEQPFATFEKRTQQTLSAIRPMLLAEMHQKLRKAVAWSDELCVPLTTTEGWGPWWHLEHPDLSWDWMREWCLECNALAAQYGMWGSTPWNFSHPYWENWRDVDWYREVNHTFMNN